MKQLTTAMVCIAGIVATTAFAQQAGQPGSKQQPGIQPSTSPSRDATYSATGRAGQDKQCRASKVIGAQVKGTSGDELGRIEDIVFNPQSGRVEFAVINHENKLVPIPLRLLSGAATPGSEQMTFTAQVDKDKLQNAPTISDRTRWSELQQGTFSQRIYSHYGVPAEGVGAPGLGTERERGTSQDPQSPGTTPRSPTSPN
jgi:sporulation protein YlmC with PRC-barrel domain